MATVHPCGRFHCPRVASITNPHGHQRHRKGCCRTVCQLFHRHKATFNALTVPLTNVYLAKFRVYELKFSFENNGSRRRSSSNCSSDDHNHKNAENYFKGFSNLSPEFLWDSGSVWSTMATYFFLLHIPLGLGGLSIVAEVLHQDDLDPHTKAISLLFTQTLELLGAISFIQSTCKPISPSKIFKFSFAKIWAERGWLKASAAGLAIIYIVVLLTSAGQEFFFETKGMKNMALEELLTSSVTARCACFIVYCLITPILEEYVYRLFLLTSLTLYMEWPLAVIVSSCIFSIGHFSIENSIQIFFIGCVLGSAYTWSGNLASSFMIHCVYNFAILMATV